MRTPLGPGRFQPDDYDPEYVVLPRAPLFEWLGEVALGPLPPDADCAVVASRLILWVDEHDLAPIYRLEPHR